METRWKNRKSGFQESLQYLDNRRKGLANSLKTPWEKFNDAGCAGIEWHTLTIIAGRPGSMKTAIKDQIIREAFELNPDETFRVLDIELEMLARTSAIREYSSVLGKSYKYLCSASNNNLTDEELNRCIEHARKSISNPVDITENPITVLEFKKLVEDYMEAYTTIIDGVKTYIKTLITLDHTILIKKGGTDINTMLYDLGETATQLKRKYPIAFIFLSQLNRNIESPERNEDGKYGNHVLSSDIFGSDAMMMFADVVIGINRPALQKIKFYGPDRYIIDDDKVLVLHWIKTRNGDTRLSFFRCEFDKMRIIECNTPPTQQSRSKV